MLTMTITNVSSTVAIGAGEDIALPSLFNWATIAASGSKAYQIRVSDLVQPEGTPLSGFTVGDALQQMVNRGLITISTANLAATMRADIVGDGVSNET